MRSFIKQNPAARYLLFTIGGILIYPFVQIETITVYCLVGIVSILFLTAFKTKNWVLRLFLIPTFFCLGILCRYFQDDRHNAEHFTNIKEYSQYVGKIISEVEEKPKSYKATLDVSAVFYQNQWVKSNGRLLVYFSKDHFEKPKSNQIFVFKNNWRQIETPKNPYEFDYKSYINNKGIYAHQFLRNNDAIFIKDTYSFSIMYLAQIMNQYTKNLFAKHLKTENQKSVINALVCGNQGDIDSETKQWFIDTGSIHALAVSGMHVALLFTMLTFFFEKILRVTSKRSLIVISILLWIYALFTGLSPSVARATVMFTIVLFGKYYDKEESTLNTLFISALVLLLGNPTWIYDVGFQLSYLAVIGIVVLKPRISSWLEPKNILLSWVWEVSTVSISAQVFTLPLSLYYFHQFPNYFLIANPIVTLVSNFILIIGLIGIIALHIPFVNILWGWVLSICIDFLNTCVKYISLLPGAVTTGFSINIVATMLLMITVITFTVFLKGYNPRYLRYTCVGICLLFLTKFRDIYIQNRQEEITFHYIPKGWGISYINGRNAQFFSSDSLIHSPTLYSFHLKNYYDSKGIVSKEFKALKHSSFQTRFGKYVLEHHFISTNKKYPRGSFSILKDASRTKNDIEMFILDGNCTRFVIEKLNKKTPKLTDLYNTGSLTIRLRE
ncbi:MAG: ComEC/Rec2 family competence protein [Leadbetterella sp.]